MACFNGAVAESRRKWHKTRSLLLVDMSFNGAVAESRRKLRPPGAHVIG